MNGNFKGMDPELARKAMALISSKKVELDEKNMFNFNYNIN